MADGARQVSTTARQRGALRGPNAAVAADHPLAAATGLRVLDRGGSAADAAIAMAAVMVVVQPYYSHLGGDLFAMTYAADSGEVEALNSSGPAPASARLTDYRSRGAIPAHGALAVTVPGAVHGWWKLHQRLGVLPWRDLFATAVAYAAEGFPASRQLAQFVAGTGEKVAPRSYFEEIFGHVTTGGEKVVQMDLGRTLLAIANGGADAFYGGEVANACCKALYDGGAHFTPDDWRGPGRWEQPAKATFFDHTIHTQPPPSTGFVLPLAAALYEQLLARDDGRPDAILQHAALSRAFDLRVRLAGDPESSGFDAQEILDEAMVGELRDPDAPHAPLTTDGDTTYILAVDASGNGVSLIQSVFAAWGSGLFVPGTGVLLNNRMCGFSLRDGHPNALAPGKRPMHTLHSYLVTAPGGGLRVVGGTPGAMQQPQTNLMVIDAIVRRGLDAQDALDLPRWSLGAFAPFASDYSAVMVEVHTPDTLTPSFRGAGLTVEPIAAWHSSLGRAYVAVIEDEGIAVAGDARGEGLALVV